MDSTTGTSTGNADDAAPGPARPALATSLVILGGINVCLALAIALTLALMSYRSALAPLAGIALFFFSIAQLIVGLIALFKPGARLHGAIAVLTAPALWFASLFGLLSGMGWGRPLRVRGRQVYPQLTQGSDWTQGERPDATGLDLATRRALEALWLHDAQKEHASVPAFARIGWLLAAVGAPADLMAWSQRAALEEVEHAQKCFALAAGYGGRSHSVEPMPDLLLCGLDVQGDPIVLLARESLEDGCQLEEFNADVAAACAQACEEPVVRAVQEQIAREERSHAAFSWALLEWCLQRHPHAVREAIETAARRLPAMQRPRAVGPELMRIVMRADPQVLLRHGRVPDERLAVLWDERLAATRARLASLLAGSAPRAALAS